MRDIAKGWIEHVKGKEWRGKTKGQSHLEMLERKYIFLLSLFFVLFSTDLNRSDEKETHDEYTRFYIFRSNEEQGDFEIVSQIW
jgi:hypothetical protein